MSHLIRVRIDPATLEWLDEVGWGYSLADTIRAVLGEAKRYGLPRKSHDEGTRSLVIRVDDQLYAGLRQVKAQASMTALASAILRQARDEGLYPIWEEPNPEIGRELVSRKLVELTQQRGEEPMALW